MSQKKRKILRVTMACAIVLIGVFSLWVAHALTYDWHEAKPSINGGYSFNQIEARGEPNFIATEAFGSGVLWINEMVVYDGHEFAFGPFGRVAIMRRDQYPYTNVLAVIGHHGGRRNFNFDLHAKRVRDEFPAGA